MIHKHVKQFTRIVLGASLFSASVMGVSLATSTDVTVAPISASTSVAPTAAGTTTTDTKTTDTVTASTMINTKTTGTALDAAVWRETTPERGYMTRIIKAYEEPVSHGEVKLTYPRSTQYKDITLKILFPMNDPKDYSKMPQYDGFPVAIPSFAKDPQIYYVPQYLKSGAVGEVSFSGSRAEMAPYVAEAKTLAIDTMTLGESRNVYIQLEPVYKMDFALSARELALDYDIRRTDTLKNLGTVPEFVPQLADKVNALESKSGEATAATSLLSDRENKKLQKQVLGYYSYGFESVKIPDNYTLYIFNVGGVPDHQVMTGALVSPDETKIVYFYNQR